MKLLHKSSQYYLGFTVLILGLGSVFFYFLIKVVLMDSVDEALHQEEVQIKNNLLYEKSIDKLEPSENVSITILHDAYPPTEKYSTIGISDSTGDIQHYRELKAIYKHDDRYYQVVIRQSLAESETLLSSLLPAVAILFLLIFLGVLFINNYVANKIWRPFYQILERLKGYDLSKTRVIEYSNSEITEFNELSLSVEKMTKKIDKAFFSQKEFNENSSHEMQTPLAIIKNKLDLLIQSTHLSEQDLLAIDSIYDAIKRLNLLNKALLLISKIENEQFNQLENIALEKVLKTALDNFDDMIRDREIIIDLQISSQCILDINPSLAEILVNNLLSNAIKHNFIRGSIRIELNEIFLKIRNSGLPLDGPPDLMFERFKKNSASENSIGLGLAIVKKICDALLYKVEYKVDESQHEITVIFKTLE